MDSSIVKVTKFYYDLTNPDSGIETFNLNTRITGIKELTADEIYKKYLELFESVETEEKNLIYS